MRRLVTFGLVLLLVAGLAWLAVGNPQALALFAQGDFESGPQPYSGPWFMDWEFAQELFYRISSYRNMTFMLDECFAGAFLDDLAFYGGGPAPSSRGAI